MVRITTQTSLADDLVDRTTVQTLTNKTLTAPKFNEDVALTSTSTELNLLDGITAIADEDNMASNSNTSLATQQSIKAYVDGGGVAGGELAALAGLTSDANKIPMFSGSGSATVIDFLDEDTMTSNSNTGVPSQQSVKAYVDSVAEGLHVKDACRVATTANITLANTQTIDGVSLSAGNRVLVKNQSTASENGIYVVVSGGSWVRADDMLAGTDGAADFTFITEGTTNGDHGFVCTANADADTVGTNNLPWTQFSGAGSITAGNGLTKSGSTLSADLKTDGGITFDSGELTAVFLADVTAGTAAASKALVLDASRNIGTIGNLTIDGVFTDGNYTFDTSGNVSGLGTVGCGAITSSGNLAVTGTLTGDTSLTLDTTTITTAELGVLDSVTAGTAAASKALVLDANKDVGTIRNLTIDGVFTDGNYTFDTSGNVSGLGTVGCGAITSSGNLAVTGTLTGDTSLTLDSTTITTAEIGVLDSVTPGAAAASKALVLDANKDVGTIRNLTIDGVFTDGNYTFDTSGNVSGLGLSLIHI